MKRISRRVFLAACAAEGSVRAGHLDAASLIDLGSGCLLPESLAGFRSVVAGREVLRGAGLLIPGAGTLSRGMARRVQQRLCIGGSVLLESALGLTQRQIVSPYVPYVNFTWPVSAKIREFYPVPLDPSPGDKVNGTFAHQPVALRRGELVLLGSPVGPALLAGDPDAHRWVASILRWMRTGAELSCRSGPVRLEAFLQRHS